MTLQSYKELIVWQKSIELVKEIYLLTTLFPKSELYGLVMQIRRAAISIPSNIAEGYGRRSPDEQFIKTEALLNEVIKMLYVMVHRRKELNSV